ncbi:hypothetical protein Rhe02_96690 [Rhizocola hellebori]|uniref:Methyltransferase domain-containing protein n=1 Tax=Rhizocola hellebori TaxID=1392758 RepID=A0A8J3QL45_9ACTN|nr:class I SAM-dependent methyltransferase [Rhizocola hellebori]GIH11602.1 hypothetical protein Rhe02_96690 [Rhizocola hellebori]
MSTPTYLMGRTDQETRRLISAARLLNPISERALRDAGIGPGQRVLDIGTGAGDVALLAAELVGPTGSVVGIDQNPEILQAAEHRARSLGLDNVTFVEGDCTDVDLPGRFDAIVGRLVLMYVADPAAALRRLAQRLNPGGVVAFQDFNFHPSSVRTLPEAPLWHTAWGWICDTAARAGIPSNAGLALHHTMTSAGLPAPAMRLESIVETGPDAASYDWITEAIRSMLPLIERFGVATAEQVSIDTLADRLRHETVAADVVLKTPDIVTAWTRVAATP